jgi:hypothetical protein
LARLHVSGGLDTAFSASIGTGLNNTGSVVYIYPNTLAAAATNQILIGGIFTAHSGSTYSGSVRLNISGTLDTTYNIGTTGFSGSTAVNDYLIQSASLPTSAILAGGGFTFYSGSTPAINPISSSNRIVLLNTDGTISGSFSGSLWTKIGEWTETSGSFVVGTGTNSSGATVATFYIYLSGSQAAGTTITTSFFFFHCYYYCYY